MTRVVWKFVLDMRGWCTCKTGPDPKVVLTAIDPASGDPAVWIEHGGFAPGNEPSVSEFGVFPTGGTIAADADHVGSMIDRDFVWHIYQRRRS